MNTVTHTVTEVNQTVQKGKKQGNIQQKHSILHGTSGKHKGSKLCCHSHKRHMQRKMFKAQNRKVARKPNVKQDREIKEKRKAGKILALGKELGLDPLFTDNDTLNIIISGIRNR